MRLDKHISGSEIRDLLLSDHIEDFIHDAHDKVMAIVEEKNLSYPVPWLYYLSEIFNPRTMLALKKNLVASIIKEAPSLLLSYIPRTLSESDTYSMSLLERPFSESDAYLRAAAVLKYVVDETYNHCKNSGIESDEGITDLFGGSLQNIARNYRDFRGIELFRETKDTKFVGTPYEITTDGEKALQKNFKWNVGYSEKRWISDLRYLIKAPKMFGEVLDTVIDCVRNNTTKGVGEILLDKE